MNRWERIKIEGDSPGARMGGAAVMSGEVMYLLGGASKDRMYGDLVVVRPDSPVADRSFVYGAGRDEGVAGKNVRFFVQLQDSFGVNRTTGGSDVKVKVMPQSRRSIYRMDGKMVKPNVEDMRNGLYKVEYTTTIADDYNVTVVVNGQPIPMFTTSIMADLPFVNNTRVQGNGLAKCIAGVSCTFNVDLVDQYGNSVKRQTPVDVQIVGSHRVSKTLTFSPENGLDVSYIPTQMGMYKIFIKIRNQVVPPSPWMVNVTCNIASEVESKLEGDGLKSVDAGEFGQVTVTLKDAYKNPILVGGDSVVGHLTGPSTPAVFTTDFNNGTYSLSYQPIEVGTYSLVININGKKVALAPFPVEIKNAKVSSGTTFAYGTGLRYSVAGHRAYFTVQTADEFGNNLTTGGVKLSMLFAGPGKYKQMCDVVDHGDGKYTASYLSTVTGDFILSITLHNPSLGYQSIHSSPFIGTTVAAGADPSRSFVFSNGPSKRPLSGSDTVFRTVMGVHNYFKIQAVDRYGNHKTSGGDRFSVQLDGPVAHDGFVNDNGDGTYTGAYVAPASGRYNLKIFYGNIAVNGTPISVLARANFDVCPNGCSNHGECRNNECFCHTGYKGTDCSVEIGSCPGNCNGNGACINSTCFCFPGYSGTSCNVLKSECPNDCSQHGECLGSGCVCESGYQGVDCSDNLATCPDSCFGNGECVNGTCLCYPGYKGANCAKQGTFCPQGCSGHGNCMLRGVCSCLSGWAGLDCAQVTDTLNHISVPEPRITKGASARASSSSLTETLPARLPRKR